MSSLFARIADSVSNYMFEFKVPVDSSSVDLLAVMYSSPNPQIDPDAAAAVQEEFRMDFQSRVWLTYRAGFPSLVDKEGCEVGITSDAGWGCSIRVTQMLIAECLVWLRLGRDWRRPTQCASSDWSVVKDVLSHFRDTIDAPLSIHRIAQIGHSKYGKRPSEWFGPTTGAGSVCDLINANHDELGMRAAVFDGGEIYTQEVLALLGNSSSGVAVLLTHRLGLDSIDLERYKKTILALFAFPLFRGLSSGESVSSAYYFFAASDQWLFYLDPHTVQPAFTSVAEIEKSVPPQPRVLKMRWSRLNPSMTMGFVVRNAAEWETVCDFLSGVDSDLFDIKEVRPEPRRFSSFSHEEDDDDGDLVIINQ